MKTGGQLALAGTFASLPIVALGLIVPIPEAVIGGVFGLLVFYLLAGFVWWMDRRVTP